MGKGMGTYLMGIVMENMVKNILFLSFGSKEWFHPPKTHHTHHYPIG